MNNILNNYTSPMIVSLAQESKVAGLRVQTAKEIRTVRVHSVKRHANGAFLCHLVSNNGLPIQRPLMLKISNDKEALLLEETVLQALETNDENHLITPRSLGTYNSVSGDASILMMEHFGDAYPLHINEEIDEELMYAFPIDDKFTA